MICVRDILTAFCIFAASFSIGCTTQSTPLAEHTPEPTPAPAYSTDDKGNGIKPGGWDLPKTTAKGKEVSRRIGKYQDGRTANVRVASYNIEYGEAHRVEFDEPSAQRGKMSVISRVEEWSVGKGRVFCYFYWLVPYENGHAIPMTTKAKICDLDGDGKYELRGSGLGVVTVPDWAK